MSYPTKSIPEHTPERPKNVPDLSRVLPRLTPRRRAHPRERAGNPQVGGDGRGASPSPSTSSRGLPADAPPTPVLAPPPAELEGFAAASAAAEKKDDSIDGRLHRQARHIFRIPSRHILTDEDLERFRASGGHELIVAFVFGLADSVRGKPVSWVVEEEKEELKRGKEEDVGLRTVRTVARILGAIEKLVEETPREEDSESGKNEVLSSSPSLSSWSSSSSPSSSRFGNKAFRTFLEKLEGRVREWHDDWLGLESNSEDGAEK